MKRIKLFGKEAYVLSKEEKNILKNGIKDLYHTAGWTTGVMKALKKDFNDDELKTAMAIAAMHSGLEMQVNDEFFKKMIKILGEA